MDFYTNNPIRNTNVLTSHNPSTVQESYFGILKRWTGILWVNAMLKIYSETWQTKPVKYWNGSQWLIIDS
jgi:hypothetical protein